MGTMPKHMKLVNQANGRQHGGLRRVLALLLIALLSCAVGLAACFIVAQVRGPFSSGGWINRFWFAFFTVACFVPGLFVVCRDWLSSKPERIYLVVVLCMTALFSWCFSVRAVGWDTGVHYRNILRLADWEGEVETTDSEAAMISMSPLEAAADSSLRTVDTREEGLDAGDNGSVGTVERPGSLLGYVTGIEYVPYALVMAACNALGVSFSRTLLLVRLTGGIFYSVVTYLGMCKLRWGKMLYASIALLPTSVFLAAELGYSYWLFSLCLYGIATLVGMLQGAVEVRPATLAKMLAALLLGVLPRVVYGPLIFLCLLIPRERFWSARAARTYRCLLVGLAVLAFCVWLIPRLLTGFGTGDQRGGDGISPSGQIAYILSHPIEYARTFLRFALPPLAMEGGAEDIEGYNLIGGYLSPEASPGLLANYGYLPRTPWVFTAALWALLLWTTITDKDRKHRYGVLPGVVSLIITFGIFFMITTALYFDFTPVGLSEIHGVQRRYLLPLVYPLLAFVGPCTWGLTGESARVGAGRYNAVVLACMATILLASMWASCVSLII